MKGTAALSARRFNLVQPPAAALLFWESQCPPYEGGQPLERSDRQGVAHTPCFVQKPRHTDSKARLFQHSAEMSTESSNDLSSSFVRVSRQISV